MPHNSIRFYTRTALDHLRPLYPIFYGRMRLILYAFSVMAMRLHSNIPSLILTCGLSTGVCACLQLLTAYSTSALNRPTCEYS